jgi:hypothetical protein
MPIENEFDWVPVELWPMFVRWAPEAANNPVAQHYPLEEGETLQQVFMRTTGNEMLRQRDG